MSLAVGSRYARALADATFEGKFSADPDTVAGDLNKFVAEYEVSRPLRDVLASPAVPHVKKRAVVSKLSERLGLSKLVQNFLFVVSDHGRMRILKVIANSFLRTIDERRGIVQAEVLSAVELNPDQRREFEQQVTAMTGKKVRCEFKVDPALLGGAVLKIGSSVYDGSVRGRLRQMGARLTATA